jgi:hypothetical protein
MGLTLFRTLGNRYFAAAPALKHLLCDGSVQVEAGRGAGRSQGTIKANPGLGEARMQAFKESSRWLSSKSTFFFFLVVVVLEFELRALHLQVLSHSANLLVYFPLL